MQKNVFVKPILSSVLLASGIVFAGCAGQQTSNTVTNANMNLVNTNANVANSFAGGANTNAANMSSSEISSIETREPEQYEAKVLLKLEAVGDQQKTALPTLGAIVSRSGTDRRMEFSLPGTNEKVIYLDKAGTNYIILPNRKQYAELNKESVGFEVRRLLLPEQIVQQVKNLKGVKLIGDEQMNGRAVTKYGYESVANTQTQAGQVETESVLIVDKETGLPLRSETVAQSQTGGNVQGYKGMRVITEMSDIKTAPDLQSFNLPSDYAKIESEQVKQQVNLIFNVVAQLVGQMMNQANQNTNAPANTTATPTPQG
jgi:hypothetical protein